MDKASFLSLPDTQVAHYLRNYKRVHHLSYGDLADQIGCSREALSKFINGKGVGVHVHKQIIRWCMTDKLILSTLFRDIITDICCSHLIPVDPHYASASSVADKIARSIKEQLDEIASIPNPDYRVTALENLYRRISK